MAEELNLTIDQVRTLRMNMEAKGVFLCHKGAAKKGVRDVNLVGSESLSGCRRASRRQPSAMVPKCAPEAGSRAFGMHVLFFVNEKCVGGVCGCPMWQKKSNFAQI